MTQTTAAIQLIVFGERNRTDFAGVLRDVHTAGFTAFEAGNLFAAHGEAETRRLLAETGLTVCGAHFGYGDYADAEKLKANIAYAKALGIRHMMCSGVADAKSVEGYRASCRIFNEVGARLRDEGITFNYHNHAWEFEDLGGTNGMQIIAQETDPALVKFNIDVFWVTFGGESPVYFIKRHAERAGYYHFKDGSRSPEGKPIFQELGRGMVDLKGAMAAAREVGNAQWIVAEQDSTQLPHLEAATISRRYMKEALGI
ncbi:MAG: sugar phosphate isomerase/epimerase family protein [Chthonomonadales bacterium]